MQQKGFDLEQGCKDIREKISEVELTINLSIAATAERRRLRGRRDSTLGDMFDRGQCLGRGYCRFSRDSNENVMLDELPAACVEDLINSAFSNGCGTRQTGAPVGLQNAAGDVLAYLRFRHSRTLVQNGSAGRNYGLRGKRDRHTDCSDQGMVPWCEPKGLQLLYLASRDGCHANAFHFCCNGSSWTITFVRVQATGDEVNGSIVGSFADGS